MIDCDRILLDVILFIQKIPVYDFVGTPAIVLTVTERFVLNIVLDTRLQTFVYNVATTMRSGT